MKVVGNIVVLDEDDIEVFEEIAGSVPTDRSVEGVRQFLDFAIAHREAAQHLSSVITAEQVMTGMLKGYRDNLGATGTIQ